MIGKDALTKRLQELYLYSLYGFSVELRPLSMMLKPEETLNFLCRGRLDGVRQMIAVTDARIIFISSPMLAKGQVRVVDRRAVNSHSVSRILLGSSIKFNTDKDVYEMAGVPAKVLDLFEWAMEQPVKLIPGLNITKSQLKKLKEDQ